MQIHLKNHILYLFGLVLAIYICLRAVYPAITCDEVFSYDYYVHATWANIYKYNVQINDYWIPNNHLLNSWAMKASVMAFGAKDWVLRLPNVVLAIIAIIYTIFLLKKITISVTWQIFGFLLLFANVYYLDFFAMARGYGMLHSFTLIGFYYLYTYTTEKTTYFYLLAALFCGVGAAFANFIGLNYLAALSVVLGIAILYTKEMTWLTKIAHITCIGLVSGATVAALYMPLKKVLATGHAIGGSENFFIDTMYSLIKNYLFIQKTAYPALFEVIFWCIFYLILLIATVSIVQQILKIVVYQYLSSRQKTLGIFWLLLLLVVAAPIVQHLYGGTFLLNRTALIYVPLWGIALFLWLESMFSVENLYTKRAIHIGSTVLLLHALSQSNLSFVYEYPGDTYTKKVLESVADFQKNTKNVTTQNKPLLLAGFRYTQPALHFYTTTDPDYIGKISVTKYAQEIQPSDSAAFYYTVPEATLDSLQSCYKLYEKYETGFALYKKW